MAKSREMTAYVQSDLADQLSGKSGSADDLRHEIEQAEHSFDFDSYAPYYSEHDDVISELESEYARDAEDFSGTEYKAEDWQQARAAWAAALAYCAYSSIWEQTKQELIEALEEFETDAQDAGCDDPVITLSTSCVHGWASHDREDSDGTMFFVSRQLDGCNGLAREVAGVWMSVCFDPNKQDDAE